MSLNLNKRAENLTGNGIVKGVIVVLEIDD